jgi:predicted dehydrogenase
MRESCLRVGLVGCGRFGRVHAHRMRAMPNVDFVGCYDLDVVRAREAAVQCGVPAFDALHSLLARVDALCVVVPLKALADVALTALACDRHVLVEKPMAVDLESAEAMVALAAARRLTLQIGYLERFHPVVASTYKKFSEPDRVECMRSQPLLTTHATSKQMRVTAIVLDLMVHDLDHVLTLMNEMPRQIEVEFVDQPQRRHWVQATLEFSSGRSARLTAGFDEKLAVRTLQVKRGGDSVHCDFLTRQGSGFVNGDNAFHRDPLSAQLAAFVRDVRLRNVTDASGAAALRGLRVAHQIIAHCAESAGILSEQFA